jgi:hypothetical protein
MSSQKKTRLFTEEEAVEIERRLRVMAGDITYNTESSYSTNSEAYPDNLIPFVDKHMGYLRSHPRVDPEQYLSNLRLMTRIRT